MGFMDLSTSASSKKHVDFNDVRYQLADKFKQSNNKSMRSTFTLYDNKEYNKIAVQEISAAYALSDKHLPIGELLNKFLDLIIDLEDGVIDTEKDAIYTWKYSRTLIEIYNDKIKRQETLRVFDNGLKNSIINSRTFIERYPGKYTSRTNFFDAKIKKSIISDVFETFKDVTFPKIHEIAIQKSKEIAEKHNNPTLDRIVQWAVNNYECIVDSYFEIKEEDDTQLYFCMNTIILHLKNGYDMSIVGYVGTEHDDQFAVSILDANSIAIEDHDENASQNDVKNVLSSATENTPISPISHLLAMEKYKNEILQQQYDILTEIRPMIPAEILELKAAESVVGPDYIWGCQQFRLTHEDLPADFKLSDVKLPELETADDKTEQVNPLDDANDLVDSMENKDVEDTQSVSEETTADIVENVEEEKTDTVVVDSDVTESDNAVESKKTDESEMIAELLFELEEKKAPMVEEKKFGDLERVEYQVPVLNLDDKKIDVNIAANKDDKFDSAATLLPGSLPTKSKEDGESIPSVTAQAQPAPHVERVQSIEKDEDKNSSEHKIDDIDSLFA